MSFARSERRLSLGLRLSAWYFVVFVGSTVLLASLASLRIRSSIHEKIVETVTSSLDEHKVAFEAQGIDGLKRVTELPDEAHRPLYVRLLDVNDATLFEHTPTPGLSFESARRDRALADRVQRVHADNDGSAWSFSTTAVSDGRRLQLAVSDDQTREMVGHLRAGLLAVWVGAIALGLLGGMLLTHRALRPIHTLTTTARRVIDSGDLTLRVPERGTRDELDELSRLFNGVLARNETLVRGMRDALDNVAHDLRTPLTRLRTGAEVALRTAGEDGPIREALVDTLEESERVISMLTTLMDISEAEAGVMKLVRVPVDLSDVARGVVDLYQHVAEERGVRIQTHLASAVTSADAVRLRQAVANLVDNAIKYTPSGGIVELATSLVDDDAVLAVTDSGMGIAASDLPRIWDRLYRADESRSQAGLGLGLSLVKAVVEAHQGRIEVESAPGRGSTFTMRLRAQRPGEP